MSNTVGRNDFHFFGDKTFNASKIGQAIPNHYDDGGFNFLQNTLNLDISKSFKTIAQGLNLGLGAEYRYERYKFIREKRAHTQIIIPAIYIIQILQILQRLLRVHKDFPDSVPQM